MALFEDILTEHTGAAVAVGATVFLLPAVAPHLSPPLRSALKAGLSLFLDAESAAEGNIIKSLADDAVQRALKALSEPGTTEQRHAAARHALQHFTHRARRRAERYANNPQDRDSRYRRHLHGLHQAVRRRASGANPAQAKELDQVLGGL